MIRQEKSLNTFKQIDKNMKNIGNAQNSKLNGEWAKHVRGKWKKLTSKIRRQMDKKIKNDLMHS